MFIRRPLLAPDEEYFRLLETYGPAARQYRQRGLTLSPEQYHASLWSGVLTQHVIAVEATGEPRGLLCCYGADFRDGHAYLAVILAEEVRMTGQPVALLIEFIDELFAEFGFRKLYAEVDEHNLDQFPSMMTRSAFELEGRLSSHTLHGGRYWDRLHFGLHADRWAQFRRRFTAEAEAYQAIVELVGARGLVLGDAASAQVQLGAVGVDSLEFAELYECLEALADRPLPDDLLEVTSTVGDLAHFVDTFRSQRESSAGAELEQVGR